MKPSFSSALAGFSAILILAACAAPPTSAPQNAPASNAPSGELRIGTGLSVPSSMIVTEGQVGYNMVTYGAGELLMRLSPQLKLEPWLAESATQTEPTVWQIKLRKGVKFHDNSDMRAQDVVSSFRASLDTLPTAASFIAKETRVEVVDDLTVKFVTPKPQGNLLYSLANWNFVVHKPAVAGISILTGPYRPTKLEKDQEFVLENFAGYWRGTGRLKKIIVRRIPDANARALALQSGDLDMLTNVAPDVAAGLPADIERAVIGGTRLHYVILNHTKAPFNSREVREAASLGVDRAALIKATLNGQGEAAVNLYPASTGIPLVQAQRTDIAAAGKLLDDAGWKPAADGIREKAGTRLAFTLYSYPGRSEITQMAIAIQAQLKPLGFDVKVEEVKDITAQIKDGGFQASMYSIGIQADPQYAPGVTLVKGGAWNFGGFANANADALFEQLKGEGDTAKRMDIARQIQEIARAETPNIYLAAPPLITAYKRGRLQNYVQHPDDLYNITPEMALN